MKFTRTVKITRVRREVFVPIPPARCPRCGCELPAPVAPGMPLPVSRTVDQAVPDPPQEE